MPTDKKEAISAMGKGHDFNFDGGHILSRIGAWWFVSYSYYFVIDDTHNNWQYNLTDKSIKSRKSKYINSIQYHDIWLNEILKMKQLDKHSNSGDLKSSQIKTMVLEILRKKD